jgi:glucose/arabinose dehydrogenase
MRIPVQGGPIELVAWGLRNPFGMAFSNDGQLYATENQFDSRGSRPIWGAGDCLYRIENGRWYGWPDYHAGLFVDADKRYKQPDGEIPRIVLAEAPGFPPIPAATLAVHGSASGFDFSRNQDFGYLGNAFIAEFGDMGPGSGKLLGPVGFDVVRVDLNTHAIEQFATNKGERNGPASRLRTGGLERPVAVRFDNTGTSMYIVDFGVMTVNDKGPKPRQNTGVLWRVDREGK